jgi:hypothetical protein
LEKVELEVGDDLLGIRFLAVKLPESHGGDKQEYNPEDEDVSDAYDPWLIGDCVMAISLEQTNF